MKKISRKGELFDDQNCMLFVIIPRTFNDQKLEKLVILRKKKRVEKVSLL